MRSDDRHVRKLPRDIVQINRLRISQAQAPSSAHSCTDAGVPSVKDRGQLMLRNDLIERVGQFVVRKESLDGRVKLEAANSLADETLRLSRTELALVRVDARERDHHVGVLLGGLEY